MNKEKSHIKQTKSKPIRREPPESRDIRTKTILVHERIQPNKQSKAKAIDMLNKEILQLVLKKKKKKIQPNKQMMLYIFRQKN